MNMMNPRSGFGYDEIEQHELQITHPLPILTSVQLLVWVVEGSGRPLHNSGHLAERAQRLPTCPRLPTQSTRAYQGGSARACCHLQASACPAHLAMPHSPKPARHLLNHRCHQCYLLVRGGAPDARPPWRMTAEARDVSGGGHRSGRRRSEQRSRVDWVAAWVRDPRKREWSGRRCRTQM
jgi:hypothetical protein